MRGAHIYNEGEGFIGRGMFGKSCRNSAAEFLNTTRSTSG